MDSDDLRIHIGELFDPTSDDRGDRGTGEMPHPRLEGKHRLDLTYLKLNVFEGAAVRSSLRVCRAEEPKIAPLIKNWTVPTSMFEAGLRLFGDSILAYHNSKERAGEIRYYPSVLLTFWAGFETFVRQACEVMLLTVSHVPEPVVQFLREKEVYVENNGLIKMKQRFRGVLDRYRLLLRYGCGYDVNSNSTHWRGLRQAKQLRDYYAHLDLTEPRCISANDVAVCMEQILLGIIWPSSEIRRTLLVGIYRLYWIWDALVPLVTPFTERPLFKDWPLESPTLIYAPFKGVDSSRFPRIDGNDRKTE